jgi:hypothetical protein
LDNLCQPRRGFPHRRTAHTRQFISRAATGDPLTFCNHYPAIVVTASGQILVPPIYAQCLARAAGRGGIPHLVAVISHKVSVRAGPVQQGSRTIDDLGPLPGEPLGWEGVLSR